MLSREQAWELIAARAVALEPATVALGEAVGRVAAADVTSAIDIPGFDRSAMDGYALRAADTPGTLRLSGAVAAGESATVPLAAGTAQRIFTGGPLPPGADTVERQELVDAAGEKVTLGHAVAPRNNIRFRGEDVAADTTLMRAGSTVGAQALPALAAAGIAALPVHRRARVAILATGDELVPAGGRLADGQIYESNRVTLAALVRAIGAEPVDLGIAPDDPSAIEAAIRRGLDDADVLLTAGGVSVGEHDHVKGALARAGVRELFWGVKIKPGKPLFAGITDGGTWAFGLPGNPLSGLVGFLCFVAPLVRRMQGEADAVEQRVAVRSTATIAPVDGRTTYLTATIVRAPDGMLEATPTEQQGSAMTLALARADGFVIAPLSAPAIPAGGRAEALLLAPPGMSATPALPGGA